MGESFVYPSPLDLITPSGWRVDKNLSITIATAYRWVREATLLQYPAQRGYEPFLLFRVKVKTKNALLYSMQR